MKFGAIFPHRTIEPERGAVRAWVRGIEEMGFDYILSYDHVIGANTASRPDWKGVYDLDSRFFEPIALLSFIAGMTETIELATGIIIVPQRQTVLFAKQVATLDTLTGGRLRIGVGTGWNEVEYEALGVDFRKRGRIFDEQIEIMRALWTQRAVTFDTEFHRITDAGLFPMPVQQPIPLWLGGGGTHPVWGSPNVEKVVRRIARTADGWMPTFDPDDAGAELVGKFHELCGEYGHDFGSVGIDALLLASVKCDWVSHAKSWQALGATHLCCSSMIDGIQGVDAALERMSEVKAAFVEAGLWQ